VADTSDETSLAAMASGARVVATRVGPYWPAGLKLVDACIAAGTQYLDLTGEILFVRESIFRTTAPARLVRGSCTVAGSTRSRVTSASSCCKRLAARWAT
jgi:short subunit dehydrogenase-like uncharacterized protein